MMAFESVAPMGLVIRDDEIMDGLRRENLMPAAISVHRTSLQTPRPGTYVSFRMRSGRFGTIRPNRQ